MIGVGGFFELELPRDGRPYHDRAVSWWSGRACLRQILEVTHPPRALVPFFICDSALKPFGEAGVPVSFYRITSTLEPDLSDSVSDDCCLLYVNYFGLKNACAARLAATRAPAVIIDDTQAFYQRGYDRAWSFNSARKFFGVPDGAYAYGPGLETRRPVARLDDVSYDHLMSRLLGLHDLAYQQYRESERRVCSDPLGPSKLAERLLSSIDYRLVSETRRHNFAVMHQRLGGLNTLTIDFDHIEAAVPFCYPFLPATVIPPESLWHRQIFAPRLWPEIDCRTDEGFGWERQLASHLLPLPIDHRYGTDLVNHVCDAVIKEIRQAEVNQGSV